MLRGQPDRSRTIDRRSCGGRESRIDGPPGAEELTSLVEADGFWACDACHSLNRPGAKRCYSCRERRTAAEPERPATTETPALVPVMATSAQTGPGVAVMAEMPAAAAVASPGVEALQPRVGKIPPGDAPVCPFLHLANDPATWFFVPDPANLCHSGVPRGSRRGLSKLVGARRAAPAPKITTPDVQQTLCLTTAFTSCARYIAATGQPTASTPVAGALPVPVMRELGRQPSPVTDTAVAEQALPSAVRQA